MSKKPKKPHYIRTPLEPVWEDEETSAEQEDPRQKQIDEEQMFREAVEFGKIPVKDDKETIEKSRPTKPTSKAHNRHQIDLHGMTVDEAQYHVVNAINDILSQAKGQPVEIRIITGKGNNSKGRDPQLVKNIHYVVESKFRHRIIHIEVSPHELQLGGTYLKGHFDLKLK